MAAEGGKAELSWQEALLFLMIPAGIGGILSIFRMFKIQDILKQKGELAPDYFRIFAALALGAAGGIGGGLAVLFFLILSKRLSLDANGLNLLELIAAGGVGGFIGYKILAAMAWRFEKELEDFARKTDQKINERIGEAEARTGEKLKSLEERLIEEENLLQKARLAWRNKNTPAGEIEQLIEALEGIRGRRMQDRILAIVLGNLYDRLGQHERAITVITETLAFKRDDGVPTESKDKADMLFNRACYRLPMYLKAVDPTQKKILKRELLEDLRLSFRLSPPNKVVAQGDDDLNKLKDDADYIALLAEG